MRPTLLVLGRRYSFRFYVLFTIFLLSGAFVAKGQCPPIVTANPPGASVCMGDSIALTCQPSTGTWQWYRDGSPIAGAIHNTFYAKIDGNYTVMVGGCGVPSNPITVVMKPLPIVSINVNSNDTLCNGQAVNLSITTGPNVQWVWLQPPALMGQTTNPFTGTLTTTTTYQVVAVDQITTCANTSMVTIPVVPVIIPGTISPGDTVCVGDIPGLITGTPATGSLNSFTYQWQISTISAIAGYSDIPGATGLTYQPGPCFVDTWFRIRVSSPPCPDVFTNSVMIRVIPTPLITSNLTRTICSGSSVNYTPVSNVAGSTFAWTAVVTSGTVNGVVASGNGNINTVLSLPAGSSTAGVVTYTITPTGPANSFCPGTPSNLIVTVQPTPIASNVVMSQSMCAGTTTSPVVFTSNVAGTTFSWIASATPGLSGYIASGTGNIPAMQIFSTLMTVGTVTYTVTPTGPAPYHCPGTVTSFTFTVNPSPTVINIPMDQTICSGGTTTPVTLNSNVTGTTFNWTATAVPPSVSGYQASGTNTLPAQTIFNPSNVQGVVTYDIMPSGNIAGCTGIPSNYYVYVNPIPVAVATPSSQIICSGNTTGIMLSSAVAGTTFSWTASAPSSILGFSDGTGSSITQTLINTSNAPHDVTYVVTPTMGGCTGSDITVVVTVVPAPVLTVSPTTTTSCSGDPVVINLTANYAGVTFAWTASATGSVTGYSNGTGSTISQTLTNNDNVARNVVYAIMMSLNGCTVGPSNLTVTVYPTPHVTNNPLGATRCSGAAFVLSLTSNVASTTYTYTANGTPGISGFANGSGNTINQTFINSGTIPGTVTYTITPTANGCVGPTSNYVVTVNPIPDVNLSLASQSICSGTNTVPVALSSAVAGTTFSWSATPSAGGITGYTASGNGNIPAQTINSSLSVQGNVTYTVIPSNSGCTGVSKTHIVTVNPLPLVTNGSLAQAICSGATSTNVNLVSNVAGTTFTWLATPSSGNVTGYQPSGANTIPPQTISNSGTTPGTVTYLITPTSNFGPACTGISSNYVTTVNPIPAITSSLTGAVCSGQNFNYLITSNLAGTTFNWTRAAVAGISNAASSGTSASINEVLTNLTNSDIDVTYVLQPYGQAPTLCAGIPQSLVVKVRALPVVNAGSDITIPFGTSTVITGTSSGGTGGLTYTWTPNAYIASGANTLAPQTINLNADRTYTLSVSDAASCANTDQMTVFISGTALTASPAAVPSTICVGNSTTISANAAGGSGTYTYSWTSSPAGFTSTSSTASVSPIVNTVYTVVVDDGFNTATASVSVTVNLLPVQYLMTGGGEYCIGGSGVTVGLSGSQSGVNYQLYNNGNPVGAPISGTGGAISFGNQTLAGSYTADATRVTTGCTVNMTGSVSVTINALPVANAGIDQTIPYGTSTTLNGSVSGGFGPMSYSWIPLINIAGGANTPTPVTTNLYSATSFTLRVTDAKGCIGNDQMTVLLSGSALAVNAVAVPDEICADTSQSQLNALASGGSGTYSYSWSSNPAGIPVWSSMQQNPMVSPDVTTTYSVLVNDGFNTATASVTVIVHPLPLVFNVTGGGSYCFAGTGVAIGLSGSEPGTNYQLLRGGVPDGPAVTGTGSPISFGNRTAAFTYTVLATNNATGCINMMSGSTGITILPPPTSYLVTGGGSYPFGGIGVPVGLSYGDAGVLYQLYLNNNPIGAPVTGAGASIDFGLQLLAGTYTVVATDPVSGCTANMNGSVSITILPLPNVFNVFGGGIICQGEPGLLVSLTGSEVGIHYQLIKDGFPYGAPIVGNGLVLNWGPYTVPGVFEVRAINPTNGGTQMMNGQATIAINPLPTIYTMNPLGSQCPGTIIRLNGSDAGVMYYLIMDGITMDSIPGTGLVGFLDFGPQTINGTYTILAVNMTTGCQALMNGSIYIEVAPQIFNVIPAGILCPGQTVSLTGSELGVSYQLRWNGTFDLGAPVPGTGGPINVGVGGLPGIYSVIGIDDTTNCVSYMQDSATLYPDPVIYSIIPNGVACEGDEIYLNGSEIGVDYVLLLENAIHLDTIHGTGFMLNFGSQPTEGNYTIIAISQTSYCITPMNGTAIFNDSPITYDIVPAGVLCMGSVVGLAGSQLGVTYQLMLNGTLMVGTPVAGTGSSITFGIQNAIGTYTVRAINDTTNCYATMNGSTILDPLPTVYTVTPSGNHCPGTSIGVNGSDLNYNYILVYNGVVHMDTIPGTGGAIDFGPQVTAGTYTVIAYNTSSFCETAMNGSSVIDLAPTAYPMTPSGLVCVGTVIGISNSELNVNYQLRLNGTTNIGAPVAGTGAAINFGAQALVGTYTVIATSSNGCTANMIGSVVINDLPVLFTITPASPTCSNTAIGLNGSEVNVNYVLVLNGTLNLDTIPGTGAAISFGAQPTTGTYTIYGYNTLTNCQATMNGSVTIQAAPTAYTMTPAGLACVGAVIGISNSEVGVDYQLRLNGTTNIGAPVAGTGAAINFGAQALVGTYTVIATSSNGCTANMIGSVVINDLPVLFTITPASPTCSNTAIGLNGSEVNVNYVLVLNGTLNLDTIPGTGAAISFGAQPTTGTYTIYGYNTLTNCQATMNGSVTIQAAPTAYTMTPAGLACVGAVIGISNSELNVNYQLRLNGTTNIGAPVTGTGAAINFGAQALVGTYTVIATSSNGCTANMIGSVVINDLPVLFTITPAGPSCSNTAIGLNGSEVNVNYVLVLNGTLNLDTIPGTGAAISFGAQPTTGTYTIYGYNTLTNCQATMNGSVNIQAAPTAYTMTPAGLACVGAVIGISNSEVGVDYQLRLNGTTNIGAPVAGTGAAINFGAQALVGTYTVIATSSNGCTANMIGSVVINDLPVLFTITPSGPSCSNTAIGLNGSEVNVNYVLVLNGTLNLDTIPGTGAAISFGAQPTTGTYTIYGYNTLTNCQATMNGSVNIQAAPTAYTMTPAGLACVGAVIGISNSELNVNYQLRLNGTTNIGAPVAGTGAAINFGAQALVGTYTVIATSSNGCTANMIGSVVINDLPVLFTITPASPTCSNTAIGLNGSEVNVNYVLVLNGTLNLDTIPGTGAAISFGAQPTTGTYTIYGYNTLTNCQATMNGSVTIQSAPTAYTMTPAGLACVGAVIGISNSEVGVDYQLRLNGTTNIGAPVAGTGAAINFGAQPLVGTYTVIATSSNGCTANMIGSVVINDLPVLFTITPASPTCSNTAIGLNGSEVNVNYVLVLNGTLNLDTIPGTGAAISFWCTAYYRLHHLRLQYPDQLSGYNEQVLPFSLRLPLTPDPCRSCMFGAVIGISQFC
ncbi:MAG: hypothetical protein IPH88_08845 [Bacteroidales bacterium]|nr:hypothetical protein [Bacteroidales bacterium]